ncbi:hypothetical protein [Trinickia fusca]|nr:hypothetical protein [Trinickia fusca]
MNTRHVQSFLMVSTAFFAMNLPVRSADASTLAAAVSHTTRLESVGVGGEPAAPDTPAADERKLRARR